MKGGRDNFLGILALLGLSVAGGAYLSRALVKYLTTRVVTPLITEKYEANLWELFGSMGRIGAQALVDNEARARSGKFIERPVGGPRRFDYLHKIMFNAGQLATLPTPGGTKVDMSVDVGPLAQKPLRLRIPILIGGMAYGLTLSEQYKVAFAKGATAAGTAANTGFGPWIPAERKAAKRLIVQYSRADWNKSESILKQADAIEIQIGQGANAGIGKALKAKDISSQLRRRLGTRPGQDAILHNRLKDAQTPRDLRALVDRLRRLTGGVPIGVKYAAGKDLEADLAIAVEAGVDFVSVDGAEAGTHNSLPILEDVFGLPTFIAVSRASRFWQRHGLRGRVSLLAGGGLFAPADCLTVLALGADAVYMGTAILIATTHTQILKVLPFEPPTQLAYETGRYKSKFDPEEGAKRCAAFLQATVHEMEEAVRALGKSDIAEVGKSDLVALDRDVAEIAGIDLAFHQPAQSRPTLAQGQAPPAFHPKRGRGEARARVFARSANPEAPAPPPF